MQFIILSFKLSVRNQRAKDAKRKMDARCWLLRGDGWSRKVDEGKMFFTTKHTNYTKYLEPLNYSGSIPAAAKMRRRRELLPSPFSTACASRIPAAG